MSLHRRLHSPASDFDRAIQYPNVTPDDFLSSFLLRVGRHDADTANPALLIRPNSFVFQSSGRSVYLEKAERSVPLYDVHVRTHDERTYILHDRIALTGIGSNSSADILRLKFNEFDPGLPAYENSHIPVMQAKLENHAVVEAAFVSGTGAVPVTLHRHEESEASVTVGFLTPAQAKVLTSTEPNYEGVLLNTNARFDNGKTLHAPLAYVSIWGALTKDGQNPIANSNIPQNNSLKKMNTAEAILHARDITDPERNFWGYIKDHMEGARALDPDTKMTRKHTRLARTQSLQEHALPANIQGQRVFRSTIGDDPDAAPFAPKPEYD